MLSGRNREGTFVCVVGLSNISQRLSFVPPLRASRTGNVVEVVSFLSEVIAHIKPERDSCVVE